MNNLNQIIIEGTVTEKSTVSASNNGSNFISLTIETKSIYKKTNGEFHEEVNTFDVYSSGYLADMVQKNAFVGKSLRIVGKLRQEKWFNTELDKYISKIVIIAEHIEIKAE